MSVPGELELLTAMSLDDLEARAWAVVYQHNREVTGPSVCRALDHFLELAAEQAARDWTSVEDQLQRITGPILDNNYAYKTMNALRLLYPKPLNEYSENFRWAPRGLLMYGLRDGLREEGKKVDQSRELSPKFILQWLSRLSLAAKSDPIDNSPETNATLHVIVHTMFSLWSCTYDSDCKARKIKYQIAQRKLNHIDETALKNEVFHCESNATNLPKILAFYDYLWIKHRLRLLLGGYLRQKNGSPDSSDRTPFKEIVRALAADFDELNRPETADYWKRVKFASFASETLECLPYYYESMSAEEFEANRISDDEAFCECIRKFLLEYPCLICRAWEMRLKLSPLDENVSATMYDFCVARYPYKPLALKFGIHAKSSTIHETSWGDIDQIFKVQISEAEASGLILAVVNMDPKNQWRRSFLDHLAALELDQNESGKFMWCMIGLQAGIVRNGAGLINVYNNLLRKIGSTTDWYTKFSGASQRAELETMVLTAASLLLAQAGDDREFDKNAREIFQNATSIITPFEQGLERITLLALALGIYLGNVKVPLLIKRLGLRAIQTYSLAWCLDGMERLWKTNLWTTPRYNCESPERVAAQASSTAMLTLDAGSLQSLWTQLETAAPKIEKLVTISRAHSIAIDAVLTKKSNAKEAVKRAKALQPSSTPGCIGDLVPLIGTVANVAGAFGRVNGLCLLIDRLQGSHLTGDLLACNESLTSDQLSYPSSCHLYLELLYQDITPKAELTKFTRKMVNAALLTHAETFIKAVRQLR